VSTSLNCEQYLKGCDVNLLPLDAQRLPFPDAHFDVVLNGGSTDLPSPKELAATLREFYRVRDTHCLIGVRDGIT